MKGALYISRCLWLPADRVSYIRSVCRNCSHTRTPHDPETRPLQLIVESLTQRRGSRLVIDDLSFLVKSGETLLLTGPNGAGKTTLIRTIAGFMQPAGGSLALEGGDEERSIAEQSHFVGHQNGLKSNLTVEENVTFWAHYLAADGNGAPERVASALAHFEVEPLSRIPAGFLSAGQKRRVALARLIAVERPLWLLDEPTSSLDAHSAALLAKAMDTHNAQGGLALAATHLPIALKTSRTLALGRTTQESAA